MKKLSKVLAALSCAAVSAASAGSMSASAVWNPLSAPNGSTFAFAQDSDAIYKYEESGSYYAFSGIQYNYFKCTVSDGFTDEYVYENYIKGIDELDYVYLNDNGKLVFPLQNLQDGDDVITHQSTPNLYDQYKELVDRMYNDGVITEAYFAPAVGCKNDVYMQTNIDVYNYPGTVDELQEIADKYGAASTVEVNGTFVEVNLDSDSADDVVAARNEIDALYENDSVVVPMLITTMATDPKVFAYNMLDPYACDVDGSGDVDLYDGISILDYYAEYVANHPEHFANLQGSAYDDARDVNGDGNVDLDDATYVLTYYAETVAGLR